MIVSTENDLQIKFMRQKIVKIQCASVGKKPTTSRARCYLFVNLMGAAHVTLLLLLSLLLASFLSSSLASFRGALLNYYTTIVHSIVRPFTLVLCRVRRNLTSFLFTP